MKYLLAILILTSLSGCGMYSALVEEKPEPEATLAALAPVAIPEQGKPLEPMSLGELAELYAAVLPLTDDPEIRLAVRHRLADLTMLSDEEKLAEAQAGDDLFVDAIEAYEQLVEENPDNPMGDRFLYQLSKAYELSGDTAKSLAVLERLTNQYPRSWYYPEAQFRRAESAFVAGNYAEAEAAYSRVTDFGDSSVYYTKALYMQGWSRFKQAHYQQAVASFTANLDVMVPAGGQIEALPRSDRELVDDSFRVLAVIFSYLGGADAIVSAYEQLGARDYEHLIYRGLGQLYLEQERYRDSAEAFKSFILRYPDSSFAHNFQIDVIRAYEEGGFPESVVAEKQFYVQSFEQGNTSWRRSDWATRNAIDSKLQQFIPELARHFHALAQRGGNIEPERETARANYQRAASYYRLYIDTFPNTEQVPEMGSLLAQSEYEAGDYLSAIESYEWVAYRFPNDARAADSAYAAITTYDALDLSRQTDVGDGLLDRRIDAELRFARTFPEDARAARVLGHAARALFDQGRYREAIKTARLLTDGVLDVEAGVLLPAWLVLAHSSLELEDYAAAESAYGDALAMMDSQDERYASTLEALAASVYKQAELAAGRGKYVVAAAGYSRVMELVPDSDIRRSAQFDAAQSYRKAGDLARANQLFKSFRKRYPTHSLSASIPGILVESYEQSGQWGAAARELDLIHAREQDEEKQRSALYLAAQYYDKGGEVDLAIARYRSYAHTYQHPVALRMEAMNRLQELYAAAGESGKQRFWLVKISAGHDAAGDEQTARTLFLAASASSILADEAYRNYRNLKLKVPLKKSLKKKKAAMNRAIEAYDKTNGYGVEQFSTLATYRLAQIYRQLASDLMASERPRNLDPLALEQYELLLEEQAFPFEEKAIAIHEANARRSWEGVYDQWVKASFSELAQLMPGRYAKQENSAVFSEDIY